MSAHTSAQYAVRPSKRSLAKGVGWPTDRASLHTLFDLGLTVAQVARYFWIDPAEVQAELDRRWRAANAVMCRSPAKASKETARSGAMLDRHSNREPEFARGDILDDQGVTSTIMEMPRDATANAAWAFREFWRTGDEAFWRTLRITPVQNAARRRRPYKESKMNTLERISAKLEAWRRYRDTVRELSQFSDHELCDIGIRRCDIEDIVRRTGWPRDRGRG